MGKDDLEAVRSEFLSKLPLEIRDLTALSDPERVNISRANSRKGRILLVDDEVLGTTSRAAVLKECGYSVEFYLSPLAALRCDLSLFALAIVDFQMPELNGRQLLLRMRALGARFPVILLTGSVQPLSNEGRVLFARCIDKGMPIRSLLDAVRKF